MVTFPPRALRLIDAAIQLHASRIDRGRWLCWRGQQEIAEPIALPGDIAGVILAALGLREAQLQNELDSCPDCDEYKISELDNQISYLRSVAAFIANAPQKPRRE